MSAPTAEARCACEGALACLDSDCECSCHYDPAPEAVCAPADATIRQWGGWHQGLNRFWDDGPLPEPSMPARRTRS